MHGFARSRRIAPLVATAMVLAFAVPAVADGTNVNYHGSFDTAAFTCATAPVAAPALDGVWNLNTNGKTAVVTMNVSYDGTHHLAFGMNGGVVTETSSGVKVAFGTAVAIVSGDHFTWSTPVAACTALHPYDHITYGGTLDR